MYFIAYKSLFRRKFRTFLASLGVGIGVLLLVVILSTMLGMSTMMEDMESAIVGDVEVLEEESFDMLSILDKDLEHTIERVPGVLTVYPRIVTFVKIEDVDLKPMGGLINEDMLEQMPEEVRDQMSGVRLVGIDPSKEASIGTYCTKLEKGSTFSEGDSGLCVIGPALEEDYGLLVGDRITVTFDQDEDGKIDEKDKHRLKIVGVYEDSGSDMKNDNVITSIENAREIKGMKSSEVSMFLFIADPEIEEEVIRRVKVLVPGVDVGASRQMMEMMTEMTGTMNLMTTIMIVFSGAIAFVFILIVMITSVMERTKEIGVLRATGWYKFDVLKLILVESLMLSIMGTIMGTILGVFGLIGMHELFPAVEVVITLPLLMAVIIFGLAVGSLAGIYPAWRAASLSPLEAFRGAE